MASKGNGHFLGDRLNAVQIGVYHQMTEAAAAGQGTYWDALAAADVPAADKYEVAEALGNHSTARGYAAEAGITLGRGVHTDMGERYTVETSMSELRAGDQFVVDVTATEPVLHQVTADCASNPHGWLETEQLSVDPDVLNSEGYPARSGFFDYAPGTILHRAQPANVWTDDTYRNTRSTDANVEYQTGDVDEF